MNEFRFRFNRKDNLLRHTKTHIANSVNGVVGPVGVRRSTASRRRSNDGPPTQLRCTDDNIVVNEASSSKVEQHVNASEATELNNNAHANDQVGECKVSFDPPQRAHHPTAARSNNGNGERSRCNERAPTAGR